MVCIGAWFCCRDKGGRWGWEDEMMPSYSLSLPSSLYLLKMPLPTFQTTLSNITFVGAIQGKIENKCWKGKWMFFSRSVLPPISFSVFYFSFFITFGQIIVDFFSILNQSKIILIKLEPIKTN